MLTRTMTAAEAIATAPEDQAWLDQPPAEKRIRYIAISLRNLLVPLERITLSAGDGTESYYTHLRHADWDTMPEEEQWASAREWVDLLFSLGLHAGGYKVNEQVQVMIYAISAPMKFPDGYTLLILPNATGTTFSYKVTYGNRGIRQGSTLRRFISPGQAYTVAKASYNRRHARGLC